VLLAEGAEVEPHDGRQQRTDLQGQHHRSGRPGEAGTARHREADQARGGGGQYER
jgi:hypothetical protein